MKKILLILGLVFLTACSHNSNSNILSVIENNLDTKTGYLNLSNQNYKQIPNLCKYKDDIFSKIKTIDLSYNNIKEVNQDLSCLKHLEIVNLSHNKIEKLITLGNPPFLHTIDLSYNNLKDIGNLVNCKKLAHLNLSHNKISDLNKFKNLKGIRVLNLSYNNISNLNGLDYFTQIVVLDLSHNKISDKYQLKHLINLHSLKRLYLSGNPLDKKIIDKIENWTKRNE